MPVMTEPKLISGNANRTLAAAIARALALPPSGRAAMGERARAAVLARYTTRAMQEATLAVYRELP